MAAKRSAVAAMLSAIMLPGLCNPASALTAPSVTRVEPSTSTVTFRAYAMGIVPLDGAFQRFHGSVAITAAAPLACDIDVQVEVASLAMEDAGRTPDVLSADLLDAAHYPLLAYRGQCVGNKVVGTLTMHGQTHPLTLRVEHDRDVYTASAPVRRADWGVVGRPMTAGATVRIRFSTRLP